MIKSMTGFGAARLEKEGLKISVELRTLNSKFLDVMIKLPREFSDKEIGVKSIIGDKLQRGKVSLTVDYVSESSTASSKVDEKLLLAYYEQLKRISDTTGEANVNCFELAAQNARCNCK